MHLLIIIINCGLQLLFFMSYNGCIDVSVSDVDFYQRKVMRLQDDINILHEELARVRTRVRVAEDYQIKYHILLKNSEHQIYDLKEARNEEMGKGTDKDDKKEGKKEGKEGKGKEEEKEGNRGESESRWKKREYELEQRLKNEADKELNILRSERDEYQRKIHELNARRQDGEMAALKLKKMQKEIEGLQQQIEDNRIHYERKKDDDTNELKAKLNDHFKERMSSERKMYSEKISELQRKLIEQEVSKDQDIFKLPTSSNSELSALKYLYEEMSAGHAREREEFQAMMEHKNRQAKESVQEKARLQQKYKQDLSRLEAEINHLETIQLQKEKEHEEEITSALQKLSDMRERAVAEKDEHIKELQADNANQKKWWSTKLLNHDQEVEELTQKYEEEIKKLGENKEQLKQKIADLSNRILEHEGGREAGETQLLIASLKDMEQKEMHLANYEDGITFLEGQLIRCQHKLEEKARAIQAASKEVASVRVESAQEAAVMLESMVALKEEHSARVEGLEKKIVQLNDQLRQRQKDIKRVERQKIVQEHEYGIEVNKLKFEIEELRKDYKRIIESKKEMDGHYRAEREKSLGSNCDITGVKKQKWLDLERQKNELEAIFREKEEQIRLKLDGELQHRASELAQLRHQQHIAEKENELLQQENKKLREELECNKENCKVNNYHSKMATVNLELALTQNIYHQLIQAKNRANEPDPIDIQETEYEALPIKTESQEPLLLSVDPSSFKRHD